MQRNNASSHRNQSLDVLRCVAVLLVLGHHVPYYRFWFRVGWMGVDLFFVLSGFLISGLLFRDYQTNGSIDWKRFLIRRGFKIYPSLYVVIAVTWILLVTVGHADNTLHLVIVNSLFASNYLQDAMRGSFVPLWSIAVEEHFYVFLPALLILLTRRRSPNPFNAIPCMFVVIVVACLTFRCLELAPGQYAFMTHMRMDSLFAGVTLGYLYHFRRQWFDKISGTGALVGAAIFCLPAVLLPSEAMQTLGLTSMLIGFGLLVAWSVGRSPGTRIGVAIARTLAKVGFYSYSIYLWHAMLALFFIELGMSALRFWIYIALSLALGIVMAKAIEIPFLALRDRLFPEKGGLQFPSITVPLAAPARAKTLPSLDLPPA